MNKQPVIIGNPAYNETYINNLDWDSFFKSEWVVNNIPPALGLPNENDPQ